MSEFESSFKWTVETGNETLTLFEEFRSKKSGGLFFCKEASGDVFRNSESTIRFAALVGGVGLLELGSIAVWAGALEVVERTGNDFLVVATRFLDNTLGEFFDLVHESVTSEFSFFHLVKFCLPVASHFRTSEWLDVHFL